MRHFLTIFYLPFLLCLVSCGNGGDGEGRCVLDCTNAVMNSNVAISEFSFSHNSIVCPISNTSSLIRSYAAFKLTTTDTTNPSAGSRPAGYVRITPALFSAESETDVENLRAGGDGTWISAAWDPKILEDKDYYLRGIITPQENFCTNSCGIFEIEFTLRCPPVAADTPSASSDVTIEARSGGVNATHIVNMKIGQ